MTVTVFLLKMVHVFTGTKCKQLYIGLRLQCQKWGVLHVVATYIQRQDSNIVSLRKPA